MDDKQKTINALYNYEINRRTWLTMIGCYETYDITWFRTINDECRKV